MTSANLREYDLCHYHFQGVDNKQITSTRRIVQAIYGVTGLNRGCLKFMVGKVETL